MTNIPGQVNVWREHVTIPTYEVGEPDKNPMFLEKRVYQGSSGRVYPYPVIDKIYDEKKDKTYHAVYLENDYLKVMILPELGGRIQRAYDKTNDYDFVYYNEVIKPALVGLCGPWISGGIEFNWPQHHRPTTYSPVDCTLRENADGSKSVLVSEIDQMYGTKGMALFTLYPDKSYIEITGQLYNRTPLPQTFLWWANPAVAVNDYTQSIFPPDVHAVMDHGKRDLSRFPIATGVYYKNDYGAGVDISRYKNIPVPTSYMAFHSDRDFVGGYDYSREAGILHVADHHISPGKKQWTWGCGDFGQAWDRNLTDENGPYIELMTGVYTDNQPDFTWLKPYEEKTFTQYFMPYKKVGSVKNASTEVVLGLELASDSATLCVYATGVYKNAKVVLSAEDGVILFEKICTLSPTQVLQATVSVGGYPESALTLSVYRQEGELLLDYVPEKPAIQQLPSPAEAALPPKQLASCEELYLTGLHLEQYRHATYLPEDYYLEGLSRDEGDIRLNVAYGTLLLRRGALEEAEVHFRRAIRRLTWKNPNPYDSEAYLCLGLTLVYQKRYAEAYDAFFKATWTDAQQAVAFSWLATLDARNGKWEKALEHVEKALVKNLHNQFARGLKGILLEKLGRSSLAWLKESIALDPFDYLSRLELAADDAVERSATLALMRGHPQTFLAVAADYAFAGFYEKAAEVLALCESDYPLVHYYRGAYLAEFGDTAAAKEALARAAAADPRYCFPNNLTDIAVLEYAIGQNKKDGKAPYYLGNLYYDKRQYQKAIALWEQAAALDPTFPTLWRNLSLGYYNKCEDATKARQALEKAFSLDQSDARVFLELDQLYKKLGVSPGERLAQFEKYPALYRERDDLYTEYVTLLNLHGRYIEALQLIGAHHFHPWEGGEGKITTQYAVALKELAKVALQEGAAEKSIDLLEQALVFPPNLGEGKLAGAQDNDIYYWLGRCYALLYKSHESREMFTRAAQGNAEPASAMYYNDQPADLILYQGLACLALEDADRGSARFHRLADYGEKHFFDTVEIEYFAVSLPDLQLFEEDLDRRGRLHCYYLMGLGALGLCDRVKAATYFANVLELNPAHQGALLHSQLLKSGLLA